ncbi:MAG TPA: 50S ribosomal protein L6 [Gammaproteobacteria bacterium]|nr:50S ribosomal protein L6 [Gammaproteobacteria bacterium]
MSRIAKIPLTIPAGVEFKQNGNTVHVKGPKGAMEMQLASSVALKVEGNEVHVVENLGYGQTAAMVGTTRVLLGNMVKGVHTGFERALKLVGVGYRAKVAGKSLELSLGYSHPINYAIPEGITIDTPTVTDIVIKGHDKQKIGQVAADIRAYRPPEPYKGKGVRYADEVVILKETKKK